MPGLAAPQGAVDGIPSRSNSELLSNPPPGGFFYAASRIGEESSSRVVALTRGSHPLGLARPAPSGVTEGRVVWSAG